MLAIAMAIATVATSPSAPTTSVGGGHVAFDATQAGRFSVWVNAFEPWRIGMLEPNSNYIRLSAGMGVFYMFHGGAPSHHADTLAAWESDPPCGGHSDAKQWDHPTMAGYDMYACERGYHASGWAELQHWFDTPSPARLWYDSFKSGESPHLRDHVITWGIYAAADLSAPCPPTSLCTADGRFYPFLVHAWFEFDDVGVQHYFDFSKYPYDSHEVTFRFTDWALWHGFAPDDPWTTWGTLAHAPSNDSSVFEAGCGVPIQLPTGRRGEHVAADEAAWLRLDLREVCEPHALGERVLQSADVAAPPDFELCGITYEITPDSYEGYHTRGEGNVPMFSAKLCMRRRPFKTIMNTAAVILSTLLGLYCYLVIDFLEANGKDTIDNVTLIGACGAAVGVLVFFLLSVNSAAPRTPQFTYIEALVGSAFFNVCIALLWLCARYVLEQYADSASAAEVSAAVVSAERALDGLRELSTRGTASPSAASADGGRNKSRGGPGMLGGLGGPSRRKVTRMVTRKPSRSAEERAQERAQEREWMQEVERQLGSAKHISKEGPGKLSCRGSDGKLAPPDDEAPPSLCASPPPSPPTDAGASPSPRWGEGSPEKQRPPTSAKKRRRGLLARMIMSKAVLVVSWPLIVASSQLFLLQHYEIL